MTTANGQIFDSNGNMTATALRAGYKQTTWRGHEFLTIGYSAKKQFHLNYWIDGVFGDEDGFESLAQMKRRCKELTR